MVRKNGPKERVSSFVCSRSNKRKSLIGMSSFETRVKLRMSASALLTGTSQMVTAHWPMRHCGSFHIRCGSCGWVSWYNEWDIESCSGCDMKWRLNKEKGETCGIEEILPEQEPDDEEEEYRRSALSRSLDTEFFKKYLLDI